MKSVRANFEEAERKALQTLDEYSVADAPVPVYEIAERMGLKVVKGTFPDQSIAGWIDLRRGHILVNAKDSP
jgi:hypothetical protein